MQNDKSWTLEGIHLTQDRISKELSSYLQNDMYVQAVEYCLQKILPLDEKNGDLTTVCYIISTLNLISFSKEASSEFKFLVVKLEKIAKALLDKNNIKAGKSKLSFLHGQLKQSMASILKSDGDTWGALWESSLGLFLSRGSANPILPFQHISFAIQTIDRGFPLRIMGILDEMDETLTSSYDKDHLMLLKIKALRLSGQHETCEQLIESLIDKQGPSDRLLWERLFNRAILYGETRELHRFLFGKNRTKLEYIKAYFLYAFWIRSQPKKIYSKLCPKVASLKRYLKGHTGSAKAKKLLKVLATIEEAYDSNIPIITRVNKIGRVMPIIETLEAEYRILALASIVRFFNQRQKQMASIFHGEYQSQSRKMSEGMNNDVFRLFMNAEDLQSIKPFYDKLHKEPEKEIDFDCDPINKVLFRLAPQEPRLDIVAS